MKIFAFAEVLVGFSKNRSKIAHFIWEICIKSGLSKSIAHDFDRNGLEIVRFDEKFMAQMIGYKNHEFR